MTAGGIRDEVRDSADDRPVVLTCLDYYRPGYKAGGPITTVSNMVSRLGKEFHFRIVTRDRDLGDTAPYAGLGQDEWQACGAADVRYLPNGPTGRRGLAKLVAEVPHDVLYLNSLFSPQFSIWPLLLRRAARRRMPVVLAPRGELFPSALRLRGWKKRPFLGLARAVGLHRDVVWHVSSDEERAVVAEHCGPQASIVVAPDLTATVEGEPSAPRTPKPCGQLKVLFLSRIHPVKNLDGALRMLADVRGDVEFNVYGPLEDAGYAEQCKSIAAGLPSSVRVAIQGPLPPERVADVIREHHVLLLPTRGENFGHVIFEALRAGCPALISDQTPWRSLEVASAGWDLPLSNEARFREVLQGLVDADHAEWMRLSQGAAAYAASGGSEAAVEQNRLLFRRALAS